MMATRRSAAGTWCGASHGGHGARGAASGARASSARALVAATSAGGASAPARSRQASGSGSGASCSERIRGARCQGGERGERTAVRGVEVIEIRDQRVIEHTARTGGGECAPTGRLGRRNGEAAHHPGVEAMEAAACGIRDETRQRREPAGVEQRRERMGVISRARRYGVYSV